MTQGDRFRASYCTLLERIGNEPPLMRVTVSILLVATYDREALPSLMSSAYTPGTTKDTTEVKGVHCDPPNPAVSASCAVGTVDRRPVQSWEPGPSARKPTSTRHISMETAYIYILFIPML